MQPTQTSTCKSKPREVNRQIEAGKGTANGRSVKGQMTKKQKKKGSIAAVFTDNFIELGVSCKFITATAPLIAEAISKM